MEYEILDFVEEDYKIISKFINSEYRGDLKNVLAFTKSNTFLFLEEKKKLIIKEKINVLNLIESLRNFSLNEVTNFLDFLKDLKIKKSFLFNCFINNNTSFFYLLDKTIMIRDIKSNTSRFAGDFDVKLILEECYYNSNINYEQLVEILKRQISRKYVKEIFKNVFMLQTQKTFEYLYLDENPNFFLSERQKALIELNNRISFHNTNKWIDKKEYKDFNLYEKNNFIYFDFQKKEVITNNNLYLIPSLKFSDIGDKFLGMYKGFYIFIKFSNISIKYRIEIYDKKGLINGKIFDSLEIEKGFSLEFIDYKKIIDNFIKINHLELIYYEFYDKYVYKINNDFIKETETKLENYSYIYGIVKKEEEKENFISIRYKQEIYIIKTDSKFNYIISGDEVENIIENNLDELKKESRKNEFLLNI
ncbi:hypothetical protein [Fusobacterium polymorphum]|uniref:hypothetical protein n=1 Tax=Fusobacterium nucleatum subsp. polymorphum TaxID=76857 RepID=UPI0030CABA94